MKYWKNISCEHSGYTIGKIYAANEKGQPTDDAGVLRLVKLAKDLYIRKWEEVTEADWNRQEGIVPESNAMKPKYYKILKEGYGFFVGDVGIADKEGCPKEVRVPGRTSNSDCTPYVYYGGPATLQEVTEEEFNKHHAPKVPLTVYIKCVDPKSFTSLYTLNRIYKLEGETLHHNEGAEERWRRERSAAKWEDSTKEAFDNQDKVTQERYFKCTSAYSTRFIVGKIYTTKENGTVFVDESHPGRGNQPVKGALSTFVKSTKEEFEKQNTPAPKVMETINCDYWKCVNSAPHATLYTTGRIYKLTEKGYIPNDRGATDCKPANSMSSWERSTKEEYESQNRKVETYQLPEKWWIRWTNKEVFDATMNLNPVKYNFQAGGGITMDGKYVYVGCGNKWCNYEEITFDQFKKIAGIEKPEPLKDKAGVSFRPGDWVVFLGTQKSLVNKLWTPGLVVQIDRLSTNGDICIAKPFNGSNDVSQFRPARPEEIPSVWKATTKFVSDGNHMEVGEVYYVEYESGFWMIGTASEQGTWNGERGGGTYLNLIRSGYDGNEPFRFVTDEPWCYKDISRTFRKATYEEYRWLKECEKAGKLVPRELTFAGIESRHLRYGGAFYMNYSADQHIPKESEISLYKPKKNGQLDTKVNHIGSISGNLYKKAKVQRF